MSDKRIIELDTTTSIAADDYVPVDGVTGGTKKFLASNLGGKAEVMTEAEWDDLPDSKLTDGKVYALSGVSPSTQDNPLWQKLGFASLDTQADDCSDAINELNTGLTTLNSNLVNITPCYKENDYNFNICQIGHIVVVSGKITGKGTGGYITDVKLPQPAESGVSAVVTRARNIATGAHVDLRAGGEFYIYREAAFTNGEQYAFAFSYCAQI